MRHRDAIIFTLLQRIEAEHYAAHHAAISLVGRSRAGAVNRHLIHIYALRHELSAIAGQSLAIRPGAALPGTSTTLLRGKRRLCCSTRHGATTHTSHSSPEIGHQIAQMCLAAR
jgi:hypothetical protein